MYCPKCGIENSVEQKYCRGCGQSLTSVRLALDGGVDEAVKILKREGSVARHRTRMVVGFLLIITAIATIITAGKFGFSNVQSSAAILIITLIVFLLLGIKTRRAALALDAENIQSLSTNRESSTRRLVAESPPQISVTEQNTLQLDPKQTVHK